MIGHVDRQIGWGRAMRAKKENNLKTETETYQESWGGGWVHLLGPYTPGDDVRVC